MDSSLDVAITMTCYKRLDYLSVVLRALSRALKYANQPNIKVYISIDYYNNLISNYIAERVDLNKIVIINRPPLGCNHNTLQAMTIGLQKHDAIIHLEDDTVPTQDAIRFYLDALHEYRNHPKILSIGGYNRTSSLEISDYQQVIQDAGFVCWGCAFWRHKSQAIFDHWIPNEYTNNAVSWDTYLHSQLFDKHQYIQVRPIISRIQNIGALNGTFSSRVARSQNLDEQSWHNANHTTLYTSDDINHEQNY